MVNDTGRRWSELPMLDRFMVGWRQCGFTGADWAAEHRWHPIRKWRFDIASERTRVAIEFDGMGFGHQSTKARRLDSERQNAAVELGWKVLRMDSHSMSLMRLPDFIAQVCRVMNGEAEPEAHAIKRESA